MANGLTVPGHMLSAKLRELPLRGFPQITFGVLWSCRLPAPAASFLKLARVRARELGGRS